MWPQYLRAQLARATRRMSRPVGLLDYSVVYRRDLSLRLQPFRARIPITVRIATDDELESIQGITNSAYHRAAVLRERARTGSKCFLGLIDGKIVAFNWIAFGQVDDELYRIRLDPLDAYCIDAHTIEPYRGQAIHTELLSRLLEYAKTEGLRHAYTRVSAMNVASWKSHLRLGWEEVGRTFVFKPHREGSRLRLFGPTVYPVSPNPDFKAP
jgi:GNAT superfamily N-acetyltransferase